MSKRFTWVLGGLASAAALLMACSGTEGGNTPEPGVEGEAQVSVQGLSAYEIQSMVVTAQPANISRVLTYSQDSGTFTGTLVLPVGTQTLTANGYAFVGGADAGTPDGGFPSDAGFPQDAGGSPDFDGGLPDGGFPPPPTDGGSSGDGLTLVASGTATVNVVANTTSAVAMRIYDLTPPPPQPDIAPYIRSATTTGTTTSVNQLIALSVDAIDLDGDPLTYAWTSDCANSIFTRPNASFTEWGSREPGSCNIRVTVTARGQSASISLNVVVFGSPDTGGAQVTGEYIPRPRVYALTLSGPDVNYYWVHRSSTTANFPPARFNTVYTLEVQVDFGTNLGTRSVELESSCGGLERGFDSCAMSPRPRSCYVTYLWTTPNPGTLCRLTGRATNDTLTDSFSAGAMAR